MDNAKKNSNNSNTKPFPWRKAILITIGIILLIVGSFGGYFLYKYKTDKDNSPKKPKKIYIPPSNIPPSNIPSNTPTNTPMNSPSNTPMNSPSNSPSNSQMNSSMNSPVNGYIEEGKQVFSTNKKLWTYDQAPYVCKKLGAELATYDQLVNAAKNGANWCNIGWFKKQVVKNEKDHKILANAGFPVQKDFYNESSVDGVNKCGPKLNDLFKNDNYSVQNVGLYDNYNFSVNCYGNKRDATEKELELLNFNENGNENGNEDGNNNNLNNINSIEQNIGLLPFSNNNKRWSR